MQKAIFIIGLPGSGKSTYLKEHIEEFKNAIVCDDFYKSATVRPRHSLEFEGSTYYEDVHEALQSGKDVVIADILFCNQARLTQAREGIERLASQLNVQLNVEYRFFENDAGACRDNIYRRNRPERVERELAFIEEHEIGYQVPKEAHILPVYKPKV